MLECEHIYGLRQIKPYLGCDWERSPIFNCIKGKLFNKMVCTNMLCLLKHCFWRTTMTTNNNESHLVVKNNIEIPN